MLKDIYIIKNKINNKVYIGQAVDSKKRFISHLYRAKENKDNSPIHDAINKLGKENFYYEILENQIENYNEKEKYWIKYYDSIVPNGYNLLEGGDSPPYHKGEECWNATLTNIQVKKIIQDLTDSKMKMEEIAKKYNVNYKTIRNINYGESWRDESLKYPLKQVDERCLSFEENDLNNIIWLLEFSTCSMKQIGEYYKVNRKVIERINKGITHYNEKICYPIRKKRRKSKENVLEVLIKEGRV